MIAIKFEVSKWHLLGKTRKLLISGRHIRTLGSYNDTRQLADIDCNACIVNSKGRLLGYFMRYKTNDRVEQFFQTKIFLIYIQGPT